MRVVRSGIPEPHTRGAPEYTGWNEAAAKDRTEVNQRKRPCIGLPTPCIIRAAHHPVDVMDER